MTESKTLKSIFITGGHSTPAVACIDELRGRGFHNLIYIGQKKSLLFDKSPSSEYRLITETVKIPFKSILAGKVSLFWHINSLIWLLRLPIGFFQAFWWIITLRPALVLTFGSHVGVPVVFWAWIFRIPVIAHEQTVTIGRANRFIQKFARVICYSWEQAVTSYELRVTGESEVGNLATSPKFQKYIFTGNPIRKEIFDVNSDELKFSDQNKKAIFITGGNQGAHALNDFLFKNLEEITKYYNVIHQTGSNTIYNDFEKSLEMAKSLNENGIVYIPKNYIFVKEMAEAYHKAFVIISRAGANTVSELLALKKKAILVPIPTTSGNEQFLNAKLLADLGLGIIVNQSEFENIDIIDLLRKAENLKIKDEKRVEELAATHKNAEKRIVDVVMEVLN